MYSENHIRSICNVKHLLVFCERNVDIYWLSIKPRQIYSELLTILRKFIDCLIIKRIINNPCSGWLFHDNDSKFFKANESESSKNILRFNVLSMTIIDLNVFLLAIMLSAFVVVWHIFYTSSSLINIEIHFVKANSLTSSFNL